VLRQKSIWGLGQRPTGAAGAEFPNRGSETATPIEVWHNTLADSDPVVVGRKDPMFACSKLYFSGF